MSRPPSRIKPLPEEKREREVLKYVAAYRDLPRLDELSSGPNSFHLPVDYHARPSSDSTLTALVQLAALRMGAQRAMVSLIDDTHQHFLAEATPNSTLLSVTSDDANASNPLWLGNVTIPRGWGVCEQVLGLDPAKIAAGEEASVIIDKDLFNSEKYAKRTYACDGIHPRFFAGAALVSPNGAIVGALCIFDNEPRPSGVTREDVFFLEDLATTIIGYLGTYTVRDRFQRGERLTRGLISFAEGASDLMPLEIVDQIDTEPHTHSARTKPNTDSQSLHNVPIESRPTSRVLETNHSTIQASQTASHRFGQVLLQQNQPLLTGSATVRAGSARNASLEALQDTILPMNSRSMFARAANIILASSGLDGVLIFDASVAATGHRQRPAAPEHEHFSGSFSDTAESTGPRSRSESSEDSSSHSSNSNSKNNKGSNSSSSKKCRVLGAAPFSLVANTDGIPTSGALTETNLARLLREYPHGKVFNYTAKGESMSSTDDSSSNIYSRTKMSPTGDDARPTASRQHGRASRSSKDIFELLGDARSVAFVPFWDYERSRWFAGCLCWTKSTNRLLSVSVDLVYFNIFSHSIMRELSRLDAVALNQQKTTFVASISHELRSPLHGILGTLEFIKDTPLDAFQTSMLNSLNSCGQTLLDTINHVMDHSKMSETTKNVSTRRLKNSKTVHLSSKPLKTRRLRDSAFDLSLATEEVVEAVFAGSSFIPIMSSKNMSDSPTESASTSAHTDMSDLTTKRKTCFIILDIAHKQDWIFCFPIGSWKRTVMNLFGNAVKYTATGYITVSLSATDMARTRGSATTITLTITDTGAGMSPNFLANKLFEPFTQENSHSSGVGLGLSIVRQIVETNGGKVEVSSDHSSGTKITVKFSLIRPEMTLVDAPQQSEYLSWLSRLQGRRVNVLHRADTDKDALGEPQNAEGLARFIRALDATLSNHLKMEVVQTTQWEGNNADIIICAEPFFEYLASIRHQRADTRASKAPITIFLALDALEAATLRSDVRVQSKQSVVEILTQPLGPYKLAYVLNKCFDRFEHPDENIQPAVDPTHSAAPNHSQSPFLPVREQTSFPPSTDEMSLRLCEPHCAETNLLQSSLTVPAPSFNRNPTIRTPLIEECILPIRPRLAMPRMSPGSSFNVLITDDNPINRKLLVAFTKKHNLWYMEAENGLEALRAYQLAHVQFDVILMDMSMPVMDGMSATRAIRQYELEFNIPRCCIIALTGLASASAKLEAWNSGIDHFMTKPVNFKALENFLKKEEVRRKEAATKGSASAPVSYA